MKQSYSDVWSFWCALRDANTEESLNKIAQDCANINMTNEIGKSVLDYAIEYERNDILKVLIKNGANVNFKNDYENGKTPLMSACYGCKVDFEIVNTLIEAGADIFACDTADWTPLMCACQKVGNKPIVQLLLDRGANVNDKDKNRLSVLMIACRGGDADIVRLLLAKQARINDLDKCKRSALDFAITKEIKNLLKKELVKNYNNRLKERTIYKCGNVAKNK